MGWERAVLLTLQRAENEVLDPRGNCAPEESTLKRATKRSCTSLKEEAEGQPEKRAPFSPRNSAPEEADDALPLLSQEVVGVLAKVLRRMLKK